MKQHLRRRASEVDGPVSSAVLAACLGISTMQVSRLRKGGYLTPDAAGSYPLFASVQGYGRSQRDSARHAHATSPGAERVREARAKEIETRTALRLGKLMYQEDALLATQTFFAMLKAELLGIPAAATRDLEVRRAIQTALDAALTRAAQRIKEHEWSPGDGRDGEAAA